MKHMGVCNQLNKLYEAKNKDYDNSFSEQFKEHGLLSSVIRLDDKMRRLKRLISNESEVKSESVEDTLMDLANYSIMTIMELGKADDPYGAVEVKKIKNKVPTIIEVANRRYVYEPEGKH